MAEHSSTTGRSATMASTRQGNANGSAPPKPVQEKEKVVQKKWYPAHILAFLEVYLEHKYGCVGPNVKKDILWWDTFVTKLKTRMKELELTEVTLTRDIVKTKLQDYKNGYRGYTAEVTDNPPRRPMALFTVGSEEHNDFLGLMEQLLKDGKERDQTFYEAISRSVDPTKSSQPQKNGHVTPPAVIRSPTKKRGRDEDSSNANMMMGFKDAESARLAHQLRSDRLFMMVFNSYSPRPLPMADIAKLFPVPNHGGADVPVTSQRASQAPATRTIPSTSTSTALEDGEDFEPPVPSRPPTTRSAALSASKRWQSLSDSDKEWYF